MIGVPAGASGKGRSNAVRFLTALPLVATATLLGHAPASPAPARPANQSCGVTDIALTTQPGLPTMGQVSVVILARNESPVSCELTGYPIVDLFDAAGHPAGSAVDSPDGPSGGDANGTPAPAAVTLRPGQTASSLVGGTDMPIGGATTCPSDGYSVGLPGSSTSTRPDGRLPDCSRVVVGPFVVGFNGTTPSGEVMGTAPACMRQTDSQSTPGPVVQVSAWSGDSLAGSISVLAGTRSTRRYRLILNPGRYRITSAHSVSRLVDVEPGRVDDLGRFGGCSQPSSTGSTIPGRAGPSPTTTTTSGPAS